MGGTNQTQPPPQPPAAACTGSRLLPAVPLQDLNTKPLAAYLLIAMARGEQVGRANTQDCNGRSLGWSQPSGLKVTSAELARHMCFCLWV